METILRPITGVVTMAMPIVIMILIKRKEISLFAINARTIRTRVVVAALKL